MNANAYTPSQIERAKVAYTAFMSYTAVESYEPEFTGYSAAEQRCEFHNKQVTEIRNGNVQLEKEWKLYFLIQIAKEDQKEDQRKAKLAANKEASADILAPIKEARRLGEFGKWLNTAGNPYRKEHFNKKYTQESVNAFLSI